MSADPHEIRLFTFPGSNAAATAELILAYADVPHERVQLRPGLHAVSLKARRFPMMTVPALQIDDRKISGSRRIARLVADELAPDRGLLPPDPDLRERVLDAERLGEQLQNAVRRMFYATAASSDAGVRNLVDVNFSGVPGPLRSAIVRVLPRAARLGHNVHVERGPGYVHRIVALLAAADQFMEEGVLGTSTPNVADFQFAPNVIALAEMPGRLGELTRASRIYHPMLRLLPTYPVSFGVAPPDEWLDAQK